MQDSFSFTAMPGLLFGAGRIGQLADCAARFGDRILLVTGAASFKESGRLSRVTDNLRSAGLGVHHCQVCGEPSPEIVDSAVSDVGHKGVSVVAAIGGGSVMDAAKAIAAMLVEGGPVTDFLEGVGTRPPSGRTLPLIAVPTTSGTGSEATKNAVISQVGENGFKKSLRHDNFVPKLAILDPELMLSTPPQITAACGMDAMSQLVESFVSTNASALTDALAADGLRRMIPALPQAHGPRGADPACRGAVAYAAFLSGVTLAHAGLGVVHGVAGPMGGLLNIPHGMACANLLPDAMAATIDALCEVNSRGQRVAMDKFARLGRWFGGRYTDPMDGCRFFIDRLYEWRERFAIPRLGTFGLTPSHVDRLVGLAANKNSPAALSAAQIRKLICDRC